MKRCVAYCRVSTDHEDQLNSIKNQTEHYINLFNQKDSSAKCGLYYRRNGESEYIQGIFADEGITGTSIKNRKAFKYMIDCAMRNEFDIIYVKNVARFARSVEDGSKTIKDLKGVGVEVYFEDINKSSFDPGAELLLNILMSLAQEESNSKSVAVKFGIRKMQERGDWKSTPPFGYRHNKKKLEIDKEQSEIVKLIFKLYTKENYGTTKIARCLNDKNIKTAKNNETKWSQMQVKRILENKIYIGLMELHKIESEDINRGTKIIIPKEKWIRHEFPELSIIDKQMFEITQNEIKRRKKMLENGNRPSNTNLFSNLLICDCCKGPLKRKKRNSTRDIGYEWTCQYNDMYGKSKCNCRNAIPEEKLIDFIREKIVLLQTSNNNLLLEVYLKSLFSYDTSNERLKLLESDLKNETVKQDDTLILFREKIISKEQLLRENEKHEANIQSINYEIDRIKNINKHISQVKLKYEVFINQIKEIELNQVNNAQLKKIFKSITVSTLSKPFLKHKRYIFIDFNFIDTSFNQLLRNIQDIKLTKDENRELAMFYNVDGEIDLRTK